MAFFKIKLVDIIKKYREIIMYLIFGFLTTVVSIGTFFVFSKFIFDMSKNWQMQSANVLSWLISVLFAYVTNKKFVFQSHASPLKEIIKFYSSRLSTLGIEMILMEIFVTLCHFNVMLVKIAVQFIVIVLNYVFGKLFVFKKKDIT